jgi:hypothetical protein
MKDNLEGLTSRPLQESVHIDEKAWNAWVGKGRRQDRARRQRLKATVYVLVILMSCVVAWFYLRLRTNIHG